MKWPRLICASSMPAAIWPTPAGMLRPNTLPGTSPARCSWIWPSWSTRRLRLKTRCRRRRNSPAGCRRWGWAMAAGSCSTTIPRSRARRAPGSCCGCSGPAMSRSSMAALPSGAPRAVSWKAGGAPCAIATSRSGATRRRPATRRRCWPISPAAANRWSMPAPRRALTAQRPIRARALPRATFRARATLSIPTFTTPTAPSAARRRSARCSSRPGSTLTGR